MQQTHQVLANFQHKFHLFPLHFIRRFDLHLRSRTKGTKTAHHRASFTVGGQKGGIHLPLPESAPPPHLGTCEHCVSLHPPFEGLPSRVLSKSALT